MANLGGEIGNIKTRLDNLYRQVNEIIDRLYTATRAEPVLETVRSILVETRPLRIEMDSIKNTIPRLREMEQTRLDNEPTLEDDEFRGWSEVPISYNGQLLSSMSVRSRSLDTILLSLQSLINYILDNTARGQNGLAGIRIRTTEFNYETNDLRRRNVSAIQQEERDLREITQLRQSLTRQGRNPDAPIRQFSPTPSQSSEEYQHSEVDLSDVGDYDDWNREVHTNRNTTASAAAVRRIPSPTFMHSPILIRNPPSPRLMPSPRLLPSPTLIRIPSVEDSIRRIGISATAVRSPASAAADAEIQDESDEIDNIPVANIPKMITCPVCLEKIKDVRLNCGHLVCRECARGLKQLNGTCPVCRQPITKTEIVYYAKYLKYKAKYLQLNKFKNII